MQYKVTNIIALVKHKNMLDRTEQICRFLRMKYKLKINAQDVKCRVAYLKDACIYDSL
tara:strand:+ start:1624 stop:1797 length:174 start_codon:yes stop_codon:yes gene_type:complete